jgi:hypothetical protein
VPDEKKKRTATRAWQEQHGTGVYMSNSVLAPRANVSHWEPKFPFDLVVAYEDTQTRNRALHLYDHLAQQLLDDYDFQCSWWKFDHLANVTLRQQASDAAADANMIILCLHARQGLLQLHRAWIEEWLPRRDSRKAALVALVCGAEEEKSAAQTTLGYLRKAAQLSRMDFFDHTFALSLPAQELSLEPPAEPARIEPPSQDANQPVMYHQMPTPRWGINE